MIRSGGIFYHLRALRFRKALWESHRQGVAAFLKAWNPQARSIILIGTSAGYSIPAGWLGRFEKVIAWDPDPVARVLFERIHGIKPDWVRRKFPFSSADPMRELPRDGSAILFCNVLGQIEIPSTRRLQKSLELHLEGREWASYHDALSGDGIDFDLEDARPEKASVPAMKNWVYVRNPGLQTVEVNAHHAPDLFGGGSGWGYRYWQWRITPEQTHLIEGVFRE